MKYILAAALSIALSGCSLPSSVDIRGTRTFATAYKVHISNEEKKKILPGYQKSFGCWEQSPVNDKGFVLEEMETLNDGKTLEALFVYPDDRSSVAIKFLVTVGGYWGPAIVVTADGPERNSDFAMHIFDNHGASGILLCGGDSIS